MPDTLEKIKHIPEIVVHGDADPTVPVSGSRTMVAKMKELGKSYEPHVFEGAGHGFLRAQRAEDLKAAKEAWPLTLAFLRRHLK